MLSFVLIIWPESPRTAWRAGKACLVSDGALVDGWTYIDQMRESLAVGGVTVFLLHPLHLSARV